MLENMDLLERYRSALIGMSVSHIWLGYGSAIFVEFGELTPKTRTDGSPGNPDGELTLMIEWSWRIEEGDDIVCGSWSDEALWESWFEKLIGRSVADLEIFGRLPEVCLSLSGGMYLLSFMTSDGGPEWALMDHRDNGLVTMMSKHGRVCAEK